MTEALFREDAYLKRCQTRVVSVDHAGIELDRTVFYPMGGGQPGDTGRLTTGDGGEIPIVDSRYDRETGRHLHIPAEDAPRLAPGDVVTAEIDWDRRHRHMRMHSALHLLCAVIDGGVTGGQVGAAKSRLDFDLPDTALDKPAIEKALNDLVAAGHSMGARWISDDELAANPDLVRTMSVAPPSGAGRVRLMEVPGIDLQPCGGTHVRNTAEIGPLRVGKIENKGKHNRRVNIHLADDA